MAVDPLSLPSRSDSFLWLLPTVEVLAGGDERISLRGFDREVAISGIAAVALPFLNLLDGRHREDALTSHPAARIILPLLEDMGWLVRLRYTVDEREEWQTRQLSAFAHENQRFPDTAFDELADATVVIIGAGGIGSQVAFALAASGVGHLIVTDNDVVDESNLNRQFLYERSDIGKPKARTLVRHLGERFPSLRSSGYWIDFDVMLEAEVPNCDLLVLCAEAQTFYQSPSRLQDLRVLQAGYFGTEGGVGPIVGHGRPICGWPCYMEAYRASEEASQRVVRRATGWNASGTAINAVVGGLAAQVATRAIAPSLGGELLGAKRLTVDLHTLELAVQELPACDCLPPEV